MHPEPLRNWVRQHEADCGERVEQMSTIGRNELNGREPRPPSCVGRTGF
jgi:hypothetical protein